MRIRPGTKPPAAIGVLFDSCNDDPADSLHGWRIYQLASSAGIWVSLKVVSQKPRAGAANYWLAWSTRDKRFNNSTATLRTPETIRRRVAGLMTEAYPAFVPGEAERFMAELEAEDALR